MNLILSHQSGLELLRTDHAATLLTTDAQTPGNRKLMTPDFRPSLTAAEAKMLSANFGLTLPIHGVVPDKRSHRSTEYLVTHIASNIPAKYASISLSNGLCLCPPELLLMQSATFLSFPKLCLKICEYCGNYRIDQDGQFWRQAPATSIRQCDLLVAAMPGKHGSSILSKAIRRSRDNSNSPKESELALYASMPFWQGGQNFGRYVFNHSVSLDRDDQKILGAKHVEIDIYFPAWNLGIEYQSYEHHRDKYQVDYDQARLTILRAKGYRMVEATYGQIRTVELANIFFGKIRQELGIRTRLSSEDYPEKQAYLHKELFGPE